MGYRANVWLRSAIRVLALLASADLDLTERARYSDNARSSGDAVRPADACLTERHVYVGWGPRVFRREGMRWAGGREGSCCWIAWRQTGWGADGMRRATGLAKLLP